MLSYVTYDMYVSGYLAWQVAVCVVPSMMLLIGRYLEPVFFAVSPGIIKADILIFQP